MAQFDVTSPDGRTIEVTAPDGATEEQAIAYAQANWGALSAAHPQSSTLNTIGTNLVGGAADVVARALAVGAEKIGADGIGGNLRAAQDYWKQRQKEAGGDTFAGQTAGAVGSMLPGALATAVGVPLTISAATLYAAPAASDTYDERKKAGDSEGLALAQAAGSGAVNQFLGTIAGGGSKVARALGVGDGYLANMGLSAAEMAGFTAGATALPKAIDEAAGKDTDAPWLPSLKEAGAGALAGAILKGGHMAMQAPKPAAAEQTPPPAPETQPAAVPEPTIRGAEVPPAPVAPTAEAPKPQDLFGEAPVQPEPTPAAPTPQDIAQQRAELQQQIGVMPDLIEQHRAAWASATDPAEETAAAAKFKDAQEQLTTAQAALDALPPIPDADKLNTRLANVFKAFSAAKEQGDVDAGEKAKARIASLQEQGAIVTPKMPLADTWGSEHPDSFNQRVIGPAMADGRIQAAAQTVKTANEVAAIQRIAARPVDNAYQQVRQEGATAAEIRQMEANRINPLKTEQMTIPGTAPELASQVVRGAGTPTTKTEADFRADFEAAKATRNRDAMLTAIEGIRDARDRATNATPAGAATTDLITPQPPQVTAQQDANISRGQALARLLQTKDGGISIDGASPITVEKAKGLVLSRLVAEIETARGAPLNRGMRQELHAQAAPVLDTLMSSAKRMTDATKAQKALDAIRNDLTRRPVDTGVDRSFAKDTPEEVAPVATPDTKTADMFPEEKKVAEQHAATEADYNKLFGPKVEESQADREAADAAKRIAEQKTAENLADLPGVSVSHEAYRTALERLEEAPVRVNELLNKANDETLPKTTRDKAKRQVKALNQQVILAHGMLSHSGEKMAEARQKVAAQLEVVREKIDNKRLASEEEGVAKTTTQSRLRELSKLVREARALRKLDSSLSNRAKITPIKTSEAKRAAAEDKAAEKFLEQQLALEQEGSTGKLPARKLGPLVKNQVTAGNIRIGSAEEVASRNLGGGQRTEATTTRENRQLPSTNKVKQAGAKRPITAKQAERLGNKDADALAKKAAQEELAAANKKPLPKTRAERAVEESDFADESSYDEGGYRDFNPESPFAGEWEASAKAHSTAESTPLSKEASEHLVNNDTPALLAELAKNGSTPEVRALAEKLKDFTGNTEVKITPDLKDKGESVAGLYTHSKNLIEIHQHATSEETVLHELTHAATMQILERPATERTTVQNEAIRQHQALHDSIRQNKAFEGEYGKKNLKEFVSEVYSNPELRTKLDSIGKPQTLLQRVVEAIKKLFGYGQDPHSKRAMAAIDKIMESSGKGGAEPAAKTAVSPLKNSFVDRRTGVERLKDTAKGARGLAMEQAMFDHRAAVRKLIEQHGDWSKTGRYAAWSMEQSDHLANMVHSSISDGAYGLSKDDVGNAVLTPGHGPSFDKLATEISKAKLGSDRANMDGFHSYVMGLHAEQVGWDRLNLRDPAGARAEWQNNMRYIDTHPEVKQAFEKANKVFQEMNRAQVNLVEQTHALPEDVIADMRKLTNYVPMYRVNGDSLVMLGLDSGPRVVGDIRKQPWLHALVGGDDKLMPLESAILRNTSVLTGLAMRNHSMTQIAYHLQDLGKSAKVMQIRQGKGPDSADVIRFRQKPDPAKSGDDGERHITIDTKGTTAEDIPTELVVRSLAGINQINSPLLKIASYANGLLRSGVTRMPSYLLSQTAKDAMNASMYGSVKANPVLSAYKSTIQLYKGYSGTGAEHQMMEKYGSKTSSNVISDSGDMHKIMLQMTAGEGHSAWNKFKAVLDTTAMNAEGATRAQILQDVKKSGGSDIDAVYKAARSMDFGGKGADPVVRFVGQLVPFFHASMTGLNNFVHAVKGDMPASALLKSKQMMTQRAIGMAGFAVAYAMMMEDDKEWKDMPLRDKLSYFHLPLGTWNGEKVKIGIPFQPGVMFYSLPLAMVENWKKDFSREDWKTVRDLFISEMVPSGGEYGAQMLKGTGAIAANYNTSTGQPIESASMQRKSPEERFAANTSELSKQLSKRLMDANVRLSPVQLDYLTNSYFGQLPLMLAKMADDMVTTQAENVQKPTKHLSEGLMGRFFQRTVGTDAVNHVYELETRAKEVDATVKDLMKTGRGSEVKDYVQSHRLELAIASTAAQFTAPMSKLSQMEQLIRNRPGMDKDAKQQQIDKIRAQKAAIAGRFQIAYDQMKQRFKQMEPA